MGTDDSSNDIKIGQLDIRYLREGAARGEIDCFELTVPPGSNVSPPHSHSGNDELIYVLEGMLRYRVGDETRDRCRGDRMFTPRGAVPAFSNPHDVPAIAQVANSPETARQGEAAGGYGTVRAAARYLNWPFFPRQRAASCEP